MAHRNAKLTPLTRVTIIGRLQDGWTQAQVARCLGVSRATVAKWRKRYRKEGLDGLQDRTSRPHHSPRALGDGVVAEIVRMRRELGYGPRRIAWELGMVA